MEEQAVDYRFVQTVMLDQRVSILSFKDSVPVDWS